MNIFYGGSKMQHKEALDILNRFVFEKLDCFKDSKEIKSLIILEQALSRYEELKKEYDNLMQDYDNKDLECIELYKENQDLKTKLKKEVK